MGEFVKFEVRDHIGIVTIDRPPVNAICESIRLDITEIFNSLNTRTDVYCVILRAEGRMFTAGHDLKEAGQSKDPDFKKRINPTIDASFEAFYRCRVPVIAAVHGRVIGMGFAYASLADVVVASEDALFSFPEITVGTVGGPVWMKRILPDKVARYHFYTATPFTAEELKHYGVVHKIVPTDQLFDAAMEVAKEIAKQYAPALWAGKITIVQSELDQYDVVAMQSKMRTLGNDTLLGPDPNRTECARARLAHREPVFDPEPLKRWETLEYEYETK